jgi:hypothetical protein
MTIQVEITTEAAARLTAEAHAQGVSLEKVVEQLLQEALAFRSTLQHTLSVAEFHAMLNALAEGAEQLPSIPTENFTRDSFYEGRA